MNPIKNLSTRLLGAWESGDPFDLIRGDRLLLELERMEKIRLILPQEREKIIRSAFLAVGLDAGRPEIGEIISRGRTLGLAEVFEATYGILNPTTLWNLPAGIARAIEEVMPVGRLRERLKSYGFFD